MDIRHKFENIRKGTVLPARTELWNEYINKIIVVGEEIETNLNYYNSSSTKGSVGYYK